MIERLKGILDFILWWRRRNRNIQHQTMFVLPPNEGTKSLLAGTGNVFIGKKLKETNDLLHVSEFFKTIGGRVLGSVKEIDQFMAVEGAMLAGVPIVTTRQKLAYGELKKYGRDGDSTINDDDIRLMMKYIVENGPKGEGVTQDEDAWWMNYDSGVPSEEITIDAE